MNKNDKSKQSTEEVFIARRAHIDDLRGAYEDRTDLKRAAVPEGTERIASCTFAGCK